MKNRKIFNIAVSRFMAYVIWLLTVLTDIPRICAISLYGIFSILAR